MTQIEARSPASEVPTDASYLGVPGDAHPSTYTTHHTWMEPDFKEGLVSVIIPTFNRAHFLPDTIRSVYRQTYRPIELLVVDDGSTDNTTSVLDSLAEEAGPSVRFHHIQQSNLGAPAARNRGLIESQGEFIQFLDSDDILHPQKLEIQTRILQKHRDLDHTWADFHLVHEDQFEPFEPEACDEYETDAIVLSIEHRDQTPAEVWSGLYRRSICVRTGPWNESLERWQDVEYNFRVDVHLSATASVDAKLYMMRDHTTGRIMDARHNPAGIEKGFHTLSVIERHFEALSSEHEPRFNPEGFYFKILHLSLEAGTDTQVEQALDCSLVYATSTTRRLGIHTLRAMYRCIGTRMTNTLLRTYRKMRGSL